MTCLDTELVEPHISEISFWFLQRACLKPTNASVAECSLYIRMRVLHHFVTFVSDEFVHCTARCY